jgi:DNA-binding MurR/RpiR family transcriptional regulator
MDSLLSRLHGALHGMTANQRRIADCVLAEPKDAAFWGVEELATRSATSVASVVRFAQALGYSGFLEMRQVLVAEARAGTDAEGRLMAAPKGAAAALVEVARRDVANIERTVAGINESLLKAVMKCLEGSRQRVLFGHGVSHIMAEHLGYLLTLAGLPVVAGNPAEFARQVANLGPKDVVVAFTFQPYSKETLDAVAYARKRQVKIIAFTDRVDAPLARMADHSLIVAGENLLFSHSLAAFAVVAHTLATGIASRDREGAIQRLRESEKVARPQFTEE